MVVNVHKSNIVHFRPPSVCRTQYKCLCGEAKLNTVEKYNYLGLVLTEFLDYNVLANVVTKSVSRALGLVTAKSKCLVVFLSMSSQSSLTQWCGQSLLMVQPYG